MDPYQVLEIDASASRDEVRKAYRRLSAKYHPDLGGDLQVFQQLQRAVDLIETKIDEGPKVTNHLEGTHLGISRLRRAGEVLLISLSILVVLGMIGVGGMLWWLASERDRQRARDTTERVLKNPAIKEMTSPGATLPTPLLGESDQNERVIVRKVVVSEPGVAVTVSDDVVKEESEENTLDED
jgi:hypothetical protein